VREAAQLMALSVNTELIDSRNTGPAIDELADCNLGLAWLFDRAIIHGNMV
jgi:hypothetical protein